MKSESMGSWLEAKEIKVGDLFSEQFIFKIPIYQRPLSWYRDKFGQLIDDICDAMKSGESQYFLGSVILHEIEDRKYDLVDGQQRLMSLAVLLAVIRDLIDDVDSKSTIQSYILQKEDKFRAIPEVMRITPWEELKEFFKKYVYTNGETPVFLEDFENRKIRYVDEQDPKYHLYEAVSIFKERLSISIRPEELEEFLKYLLNNVYLVYIRTSAVSSAFRLFNVLNTRGLSLSAADILKSENLGSIADEGLRYKYAKIWRELEEDLGRIELNEVIGFVRTIRAKEKARLSMYDEYRKLFNVGTVERGTKFFDLISNMAKIYDEKVLNGTIISGDKGKQNKYKMTVDLMRRFIPFSDWIPPLLAFHNKFSSDEVLSDFLFNLEKKAFLEWAIGFTYTERITSMNRIIRLVDDTNAPEDVLKKMLLSVGEGKPQANAKEDFITKLDDAQFYSLYGRRFAKYALLRIDMEMWEIENFPGYPGMVTVEHILPRTPPEDSEWMRIFSSDERLQWTNKLGNLVLLSGRKNSAARNYDFETKKQKYFKGKSTPFMVTREIEKNENWNMYNLKQRHNELINRIVAIYNVQ